MQVLSSECNVKLTIYNAVGQIVRKLVDKRQSAGKYSVTLNIGDLASGVYIYQLKAGKFRQTKRMILLR